MDNSTRLESRLSELVGKVTIGSHGDSYLLESGMAWVDEQCVWHAGQPDPAELGDYDPDRLVRADPALRRRFDAANAAALEVGRLLSELDVARAKYNEEAREARRMMIAARAAEMSKANLAPYVAKRTAEVHAYFNRRAAETAK